MALEQLERGNRVVVATGNPGKLREFQSLLGQDWALVAQSEFGIDPVEETGATFAENALIKARHAAGLARLPALADDSGLEVDALDGAPGIYSARFAGHRGPGADAANNARLLADLRDLPPGARTARFRCVVVLVRSAEDPDPLFAEGTWEGRIAPAIMGDSGFGYDPLFIDPDTGLSAAQMDADRKNQLSHRGIAVRKLRQALENLPRGFQS